jgi:hypothetical protein
LEHLLVDARKKFFSNKETIFAGFASLLTQGQAASYPHRAFVAEAVGQKVSSPHPSTF